MFANNLTLCRFILRRDRISIIIWLIVVLALTVGYGSGLPGMYPSEAERQVMRETLQNPAMIAMLGPVYDEGGYTIGAMYSNYMLLWSVMIMAIMNIFLVIRHTRKDEELGRHEVIRSLPVGRMSNLSSTLSVALAVNVLFAVCIGFGLTLLGETSMGFEGSMLFGAACGAIGMFFASVTAIICQLCGNSSTATGYAFAFFGVSFIIRAVGDLQSELLACISPLGLILRIRPYTSDIWWPLFAVLGIALTFTLIAFRLCSSRDLGAGLLSVRPGSADASRFLNSTYGLAWRLLRTPFIIWTAVAFMLGASYGSIMGDLEAFIETNEMFRQIFSAMGGQALVEQFISFTMAIMAIINTIPILIFTLTARTQEKRGYAENLLSRSVSRFSHLSAYALIAVVASVLMPLATAVGFWSASTAVMEVPIPLVSFIESAFIYVPVSWFMIGIAVFLVAYCPRLTLIVWVLLGYSFFMEYVGSAFKFPAWMLEFNPYHHVPTLGMIDSSYIGIIILTVISVVLVAVGFTGYRNCLQFL